MSPSFRTITIPAGSATNPGIVTELVAGRYYATVTTTDRFFVRANQGAQIEQNQGRRFGSADGQEFSKLTFFNYTAVALTITYYCGPTEYVPDPSVVATIASLSVTVSSISTNAPTASNGYAGTLAATATLVFTDVGNTRKSFSVFNNHATDDLHVLGANGALMHIVPARTGYPVESGGTITLYNPGANPIDYAACVTSYV